VEPEAGKNYIGQTVEREAGGGSEKRAAFFFRARRQGGRAALGPARELASREFPYRDFLFRGRAAGRPPAPRPPACPPAPGPPGQLLKNGFLPGIWASHLGPCHMRAAGCFAHY